MPWIWSNQSSIFSTMTLVSPYAFTGHARLRFRDRHVLRHAVNRGGRRENDLPDARPQHRGQQRERSRRIVLEVDLGNLHRFAHRDVSGEMDHRIAGLLLHYRDQAFGVEHVDHAQARRDRPPRDARAKDYRPPRRRSPRRAVAESYGSRCSRPRRSPECAYSPSDCRRRI